jgi:hypothetical protein
MLKIRSFDKRGGLRFIAPRRRKIRCPAIQRVDKGECKDDIARSYLEGFSGDEGVLFVGKAQEKAWVFRIEKKGRFLGGPR